MFAILISSTLVWAAAWLVYRVLLAPLACHGFNRVYLVSALLAGGIVPWLADLLPGPGAAAYLPAIPTVTLPELVVSAVGTPAVASAGPSVLPWLVVYLIGFATALQAVVRDLYRLHALRQNSQPVPGVGEPYGLEVRETLGDQSPCSWGSTVYVGDWHALSAAEQRAVLLHEAAHSKYTHRADTLLASLACVAAWFNPFVYALRRELRLVHEYQADRHVLRAATTVDRYRGILLHQQFGARTSTLAPAFNQSPLKNRFTMMSKSFARTQVWRPTLAVIALLFFVVSCAKEEITDADVTAVAEANTDQRLAESAQASIAGRKLIGVDTITYFDPATGEEQTEVVFNYEDSDVGDVKSRTEKLTTGNSESDADSREGEMVRSLPVYKVVDEMPHYPVPGCAGTSGEIEQCHAQALLDFVYSAITYPAIARERGVEGTAVISFVVGTDGELLEPNVVRSPDTDDAEVSSAITEELMKVVKSMPAWIPGKQAGNAVQVRFNLPVRFKLSDE